MTCSTTQRAHDIRPRSNDRAGSRRRRSLPAVESLECREVLSGITAPAVYQNPYMAPNNISEIHLNSYQTDTFSTPGPASLKGSRVHQGAIKPGTQIAGTVAVDTAGDLITIRVGPQRSGKTVVSGETLMMINPVTLKVMASTALPNRPGDNGTVSFSGGGYFYLNNQNQVVCVTGDQEIRTYNIGTRSFSLEKTYNLQGVINSSDVLNSVLPDSSGNLWFITHDGVVGYVDSRTGAIQSVSIPGLPGSNLDETNTKSFATDGDGGVYVVTDYALYRFGVGANGAPEEVWRTAYERGTRVKPGQNQQGSGTTPTCFDDASGNQYVAITDNADPFMHVDVFDRTTGQMVAQQSVFTNLPFQGDTENSLIAVNDSILVENNYGNSTIASAAGARTTEPDIDRVDFNPVTGQSQLTWQDSTIAVPSIVSQLSTADGTEYTYAKDARGWYWAAVNYQTGAVVAKRRIPWSRTRSGELANNFYGGLTVAGNGTAYAGVLGGIVSWAPGKQS